VTGKGNVIVDHETFKEICWKHEQDLLLRHKLSITDLGAQKAQDGKTISALTVLNGGLDADL
jgi:hypothetical protein